MKGLNLLVIVFVGIFMLGLGSANSALTDGDSNGYYDIHNCTELQNMSLNLSANYELMNDIDCSDTRTWNGGAGFVPIGNSSNKFEGNFNGNGYTIFDFYILEEFPLGPTGLFRFFNGSLIDSLHVVNGNVSAFDAVGGLVGMLHSGTISNSSFQGIVFGNATDIGGVGGLVGCIEFPSTISNSYFNGNVTGHLSVGGLVGFGSGYIYNTYSTGNVVGDGCVGGVYWLSGWF